MKKNELIKQIINKAIKFQRLILANWEQVDNKTLNSVTKEYLTFLMYCVIYMLQNNNISTIELDDFTKTSYKKVVKYGLLKEGELLDYEKLSRQRYMDFYQILSEGTEKDQLEGKRLNALIAKEVLYIEKLLSGCSKKENAWGELYPELSSAYNGLILMAQLIFKI